MTNNNHNHHKKTMRAVIWEGKPYHVAVRDVPMPHIQEPNDAIIRVTTAAICGSDLHIYHGVMGGTEVPYPIGHEAVGIVTEIGSAVDHFKVGDRVVIPCVPDQDKLIVEPELLPTSYSIYGEGNLLGTELGGCQAEYIRVPEADESLVEINEPHLEDKEWLFMSDIFATGWSGLDFAGFEAGDTVAIFGAGPVGLMAAYSAIIRGAARVYSIDHVEARLEKAKSIGAIPINFTKGEASAQILEHEPAGVKRCVDCVGEECLNANLKVQQNYVITQAVKCTSFQGGIGVPGVYYAQPSSEGTPRGNTVSPEITFPVTLWWLKGLTLRGGIADIQGLQDTLFQLIKQGRARPGFIVSGVYDIEDAPKAYERFDKKQETKVLFFFPWHDDEHHHHRIQESATSEKNGSMDLYGPHRANHAPKRNGSTKSRGALKRRRHFH